MFGRIHPLFVVLTFVFIALAAVFTYSAIVGDMKDPKAKAAQEKKEKEAAARNNTITVVVVCIMLVVFAGIGAKMYLGYKARNNPVEAPPTEEELWAQKRAQDPDVGSP